MLRIACLLWSALCVLALPGYAQTEIYETLGGPDSHRRVKGHTVTSSVTEMEKDHVCLYAFVFNAGVSSHGACHALVKPVMRLMPHNRRWHSEKCKGGPPPQR